MRDTFSSFHPSVNFIFFISAAIFTMLFMNPLLLAVSLICSTAYSIFLSGAKALKFNLKYMLPMTLLIIIINPLFSHKGATILFYLFDNPITLESVYYGIANAAMMATVITWFYCYNAVMQSDKFIYLFGKRLPTFSLIFSMTLGFVPKFSKQLKNIVNAQKCIGKDISKGPVKTRVKNASEIVYILITWALENSVETADSMRARGYGIPGRSTYTIYKFDNRDRTLLVSMLVMLCVIVSGVIASFARFEYFPTLEFQPPGGFGYVFFTVYAAFMLIPVFVDVTEEVKWKRLKSAI